MSGITGDGILIAGTIFVTAWWLESCITSKLGDKLDLIIRLLSGRQTD